MDIYRELKICCDPGFGHLRIFVYKEAYYMRADEASPSGDYYISFHFAHESNELNEWVIYGKYLNLLLASSPR